MNMHIKAIAATAYWGWQTVLSECRRCCIVYTHRLTTAAHGYLATSIRTYTTGSKSCYS